MKAAQYVRMSTERQDYSIPNQLAAIKVYAELHNFEIIKTYADPGRSGVDLARRPGLKALLADVATGPEFQAILVYDVTRWGRFQDIDESAYHEFVCKRAGVRVHYCAEPFSTEDASALAALLKAVKRVMAGEYLRELSEKVFEGQCRIARSGHKLGGRAGYGLRRLIVASNGSPKQILADGERKSVASDRVVYVPGPPEEVEVVRRIYSLFLDEHRPANEISRILNSEGVRRDHWGPWNPYAVNTILNHPKYCGCVVFNRVQRRLGSKTKRNPKDQWIVVPNSFEPIISPERFAEVRYRRRRMLDTPEEDLISDLKTVLRTHGKLTLNTIRMTPNVTSPWVYTRRFGNLKKAYELAGYEPRWTYFEACVNRRLAVEMKPGMIAQFMALFRAQGRKVYSIPYGLCIRGLGLVGVTVAQWVLADKGKVRWEVRMGGHKRYKRLIAGRISLDRKSILDYIFVPQVPSRKTFGITADMLRGCPRGTAEYIARVVNLIRT